MSEEGKGKKKYTFKVAFMSVVCTLLFIIILLLFVLFGLQKCSSHSSGSSIGNSSSMKYNYDNEKIDNTFKRMVKNQLFVDGFDEDTLTNVISVTYSDSNSSFNLNIEVRSESKVYYYQLSNYPYSASDNFVPYLLSLDLDTKLSLDEGNISIDTYLPTSETISTDKECKYLISNNMSLTNKYFSGFYYQNNEYYIYQHIELTSNPFSEVPNQIIGLDSPLYGYYQSLNI